MKTCTQNLIVAPALLVLISTLNSQLSSAFAQGTASTYQGRLIDGGNPANGSYELRFALYDNSVGGNLIAGPLTNGTSGVSNGLFTVTIDFGNVFPGSNRWLEIAVRTNGGGAFTALSARQPLTSTPYAITAGNVISGGLAAGTYGNAVTFSNAANSFAGNGAALLNVNAVTLGGLAPQTFWQSGGNMVSSGQFVGSINSQPLDLRANDQRVMEFAYASNSVSGSSPNVIGGNSANNVTAGVVGATIGGGGMVPGFLSGPNTVTADFGTVVGGSTCSAQGYGAIAGGNISTASGQSSVALGSFSAASGDNSVAMGSSTASGTDSTAFGFSRATNNYATAAGYKSVAGGVGSTAMGSNSIASAGYSTAMGNSTASGQFSTALGNATASGQYSTALGLSSAQGYGSFAAGIYANAVTDHSFVWSDGDFPFGIPFKGLSPWLLHHHSLCVLLAVQRKLPAGGVGIGTSRPSAALDVSSRGDYTMPQLQLQQQNYQDSCRLRMNVYTNLFWEIDVGSGSAPVLEFWYGGASSPHVYMDIDGNLWATSFNLSSDRKLKENFSAVSPQEVLDKVAALPITRWNFKEDKSTKHLGPMAQDFRAAFGLGMDDKHIATVDEEGVALAAIQGLNQKLEKQSAQIQEKDAAIQELKQNVAELKKMLHILADKK